MAHNLVQPPLHPPSPLKRRMRRERRNSKSGVLFSFSFLSEFLCEMSRRRRAWPTVRPSSGIKKREV